MPICIHMPLYHRRWQTHEQLTDRAQDGGGRLSDRIQRRWNIRDRRSRWLRNDLGVLEALPSISWHVAWPFQNRTQNDEPFAGVDHVDQNLSSMRQLEFE